MNSCNHRRLKLDGWVVFPSIFLGVVFVIMAGFYLIPEPEYVNSVYYQDCLELAREYRMPVYDCVTYSEANPGYTGHDIVYELTTSPGEKLLDTKLGQIDYNNKEILP